MATLQGPPCVLKRGYFLAITQIQFLKDPNSEKSINHLQSRLGVGGELWY